MPDHNRPWPAKNVERPLPPRSAWPADRPTSGLCYSPRHVHVCPYVHDCLRRQAIWTVSRPASRPCPLRNARILNVPPHSHCALSRQAVSLHELSLQPAFINIIVVGTNMVSSPPFASRRHSPRWAKPHLPRMRLRGVACGRDGGWRLVETQWWKPETRASLGIGAFKPSRYFTQAFRSFRNDSAISWLNPLRTTMRCTVTCVRSTGIG